MEIALLVARLLLAGVFAVAGLAKLADRAGTRRAVADFGAPGRLASPLALLLPLAELAVAVALIPKSAAWWGAVGALALLVIFIGAIAANLARGRKPDCRCFGQVQSSPVGWRTVARNAVLAAVAGFIVALGRNDAGASAVAWLGDLSTLELIAVAAGAVALLLLAAQALFLLNVMRQQGRMLFRIEALEQRFTTETPAEAVAPAAAEAPPEPGLPVGSPAPGFQLPGLYGEMLTLDALRASGKPVMLLFGDPSCGPCNALLPEVGRWQRAHAADLTIAVITRGTPDENRAKAAEHGITNVLLQQDREVAEAYQENGTPAAVVVRPDGTVGSPLAAGADAIQGLVARTVGTPGAAPAAPQPSVPPQPPTGSASGNGAAPATPTGPKIGDPAPTLRLNDLSGRAVNLAGYRGTKTLLLFWNPGCGFCQQMLDELRAWDANPPEGAPKLLVVATGSEEELRAMGLRSRVLVDQSFTVAHTFGANGTPMAVLVDEEGRIASDVAAGAPAVMALARGQAAPPPQQFTPEVPKPGDPAPALQLPDTEGRTRDLAEFRGTRTLVLFWNPGCGFCSQMLPDLRAWDANPPPGSPRLLVVFTGTADEARAMALRAPVLLDPSFTVAHTFGANGTPMAVVVDEQGRIASDVTAGADAVFALANGEQRAQPASA